MMILYCGTQNSVQRCHMEMEGLLFSQSSVGVTVSTSLMLIPRTPGSSEGSSCHTTYIHSMYEPSHTLLSLEFVMKTITHEL